MSTPLWSPKQQSYIRHSSAFINLAHGAVRAGKTHSALIAFTKFCVEGPPGRLAIFGKTERTIRENVIYPLMDGLPNGSVKHVQGSGEVFILGRACRLFGASDARAVDKVQGSTLSGGYMNELTLYPEELFNMAISRSLTVEGAKWFADCNPASAYHWLREKFILGEHPKQYFKSWWFQIEDNPILPIKNVEMLKALYGGPGTLFYRRYIDGEWVAAMGAIYPMFNRETHVVRELPAAYDRLLCGVDYGTTNPTVFVLIGRSKGVWYVIKEWRHDSLKSGKTYTDVDYSLAMREFLRAGAGYWQPETIEVDPSAASLKTQLIRDRVGRVVDADHDVDMGISRVQGALAQKQLLVHESCEDLIREMANYVWDERATERGVDAPVKRNDHGPDALRYACMRAFGPQPRRSLRVVV